MLGRYRNAASRAGQAASYIRPEILAIPGQDDEAVPGRQAAGPVSAGCSSGCCATSRTRSRDGEEKLLAMQSEMADAAEPGLPPADRRRPEVRHDQERTRRAGRAEQRLVLVVPALARPRASASRRSTSTTRSSRPTRTRWPRRWPARSSATCTTPRPAAIRARCEASLFPDNVPVAVYDNLIAAVRRHLPALYRYYDLRRRKMKLKDIHHYDTYVPILSELKTRHTWNQAVEAGDRGARAAGQRVLRRAGARACTAAGAIATRTRASRAARSAAGSYDGDPYILMNYQPDVLDHVFTLAHEAGHSMHSYYSAKHQPFQYYNYTIFVAEVASTFNEQLLSRHLMAAGQDDQRAGLSDQPRDRRHPRHDHPADDVRRVREDHARAGRGGRAADGRPLQERVPQAARARTSAPTSRSTTSCRWNASASRTSTARFTSTSTPPACRPRSPWPSASPAAARRSSTTTWASSRAAARSTRSTCCATPASTWNSRTPVDTALGLFRAAGRRAGRAVVGRRLTMRGFDRPAQPPKEPIAMQLGLVTYQWGADWDLPTLDQELARRPAFAASSCAPRTSTASSPRSTNRPAQGRRQAVRRQPGRAGRPGHDLRVSLARRGRAEARTSKRPRPSSSSATTCGGSGVKVRPNGLPAGVPDRPRRSSRSAARSTRWPRSAKATASRSAWRSTAAARPRFPTSARSWTSRKHPGSKLCWNCNTEDLAGAGLAANFD